MSLSSLVSRSSKAFRASTLVITGIIVAGASFAVASSDIIYGSESLLAAAVSTFSSSPIVTISRNAGTPKGEIAPYVNQVLGVFDVKSKNINLATLTNIRADVTINSGKTGLQVSQFSMRYGYCATADDCRSINIPLVSITQKGTQYRLNSSTVNLPVYANRPGTLEVAAYSYYTTPYVSGSKTASVKADVRDASVAGSLCKTITYGYGYGYDKCNAVSFRAKTGLAYGNWLRVIRSYGYGY